MCVPQRPLKLRVKWSITTLVGGGFCFVLGIGGSLAAAIWQFQSAKAICDENVVWSRGVKSLDSRVTGEVTTHELFFQHYDLAVSYADAAGNKHSGTNQFISIFAFLDPEAVQPEVRYLRDDSQQFAVWWAIKETRGRWFMFGMISLVALGLGAGVTCVSFRSFRQYLDVKQCAARSTEISLRITAITRRMTSGRLTGIVYKYEWVDLSGCRHVGKVAFSPKEEPLFADETHASIVALLSDWAPRRPVVLHSDLYPFSCFEPGSAR